MKEYIEGLRGVCNMKCVEMFDDMDAEVVGQMFDWMDVTNEEVFVCFDEDQVDDLISEIEIKIGMLDELKKKLEKQEFNDYDGDE